MAKNKVNGGSVAVATVGKSKPAELPADAVVEREKGEKVGGEGQVETVDGIPVEGPSAATTKRGGRGGKVFVTQKAAAAPTEQRDIMYPEFTHDECVGENALKAERAMELLGWREVETQELAHFRDLRDKFIFLDKNVTNRPLYMGNVAMLKQDMLNKRWKFNGEPIIIGQRESVLNGQHQLIGLVLAEQERQLDFEIWEKIWGTEEVSIEKLIVYGIPEDDSVINTMDTCKARSITDVIYRKDAFSSSTIKERKDAARMTDHAIRLVWERTGIQNNPYAPRRTHTEALEFLEHHKSLIDCVAFIAAENEGGKIEKFLSPGYAAGLLYLMSASETDPMDYYGEEANRDESSITLSRYEDACRFWNLLHNKETAELQALRMKLKELDSLQTGGLGDERDYRIALIAKAWNLFINGKTIDKKTMKIETATRNEKTVPAEKIDVGGIDLGPDPKKAENELRREAEKVDDAMTPPMVSKSGKEVGKKRGRPKKEVVEEATDNDEVVSDPTEEELWEEEAPKVRKLRQGKGKMQEEETEEEDEDPEWKPIPTKKQLGKKAKVVDEDEEEEPEEVEEEDNTDPFDDDEEDEDEDEVEVPRKRNK